MRLKKWKDLPTFMQKEVIRPYYDVLSKRAASLLLKRFFDFFVALGLLVLLSPLFLVIFIVIKRDSTGKVLFSQVRVTAYGREFRILKFRTMIECADCKGPQITAKMDSRITRVGLFLRKYRLDEIPQLFNVLKGDMTIVGVRPESPKYVKHYSDEMIATFLLPAGITSRVSVAFKDESDMLSGEQDIETAYINKILPIKMQYNLEEIKRFSFLSDIGIMFQTLFSVWDIKHKNGHYCTGFSHITGENDNNAD